MTTTYMLMVRQRLHDDPVAVLAAVEYDGWTNQCVVVTAWWRYEDAQLPVWVGIPAIASEAVLSLLCCDVLLPSGPTSMRRHYRILADNLDIAGSSRHSHLEVMVV